MVFSKCGDYTSLITDQDYYRDIYRPGIGVPEWIFRDDIPKRLAAFLADSSSVRTIYRRNGVEILLCQPFIHDHSKDVVIKISSGRDIFFSALHEYQILNHLQGKEYVVEVKDSFVLPNCREIIILEEPLLPLQKEDWKEPFKVFILGIQLCNIFTDLIKEGITYYDISPENILFRRGSMQPVLSDFNCVVMSNDYPEYVIGTPPYIAPEVLDHGEYGEPAEVYALGVLLGKLLMEKECDYYFPYDDVSTLRAYYDYGNIKPYSVPATSEIDCFFGKYPSLAKAVNKVWEKRFKSFEELKESIIYNELKRFLET